MKASRRSHKTAGRLFSEPERPSDAYVAQIDGAARGNPGPASYAVLIRKPTGEAVERIRKAIGQTTNNVAEYYALIAALDYAAAHGITKLSIRSDSELLVRQIQGRYKVKSASLRPLHERARKLAQALAYFSIEYVPREQNREADALANAALDRKGSASAREMRPDETPKPKAETRAIRARYTRGLLVPAEPLDLEDGEEVEITIYKPPHH